MRKLLWKEWHEQAWKLAFGCIVLAAMAAIGLHARMVADATMLEWVCVVGVMLLPILASTGLVPAERAEGTLESLLAMPVAAWRVLLAKTLLGALLCVGPIAIAAAVSVAMAGGREMSAGPMLAFYAGAAASSAALLVWMVVLTVRLPSEARAAMVATGVLMLWLLASVALAQPPVRRTLWTASPFAFVFPVDSDGLGAGPPVAVVVAVQAVLLVAAWLLAVRPFTRATEAS